MKLLFLFALVLSNPNLYFAQSQINLDYQERAKLCYGYLYNQDTILKFVISNNNNLRNRAIEAKEDFQRIFSRSRELITLSLDSTQIIKICTVVNDTIAKYLSDTLNHIEFIELVEQRARGQIEPPILATLLLYEYFYNPLEEVKHGFVNVFKTNISRDIELVYKVPMSWRLISEPVKNVSGLLATFRSADGVGNEIIYISAMRKADLDTTMYRKKSFQRLSYSKPMANMVLSGSDHKILFHSRQRVAGLNGHCYRFRKNQIIGDQHQYLISLSYNWVYQNYIFLVTYSVIDVGTSKNLKEHYEKFDNLFLELGQDLGLIIK